MISFSQFLLEELDRYQKYKVNDWTKFAPKVYGKSMAEHISDHIFPEGKQRLEIPLESDKDRKIDPHPAIKNLIAR